MDNNQNQIQEIDVEAPQTPAPKDNNHKDVKIVTTGIVILLIIIIILLLFNMCGRGSGESKRPVDNTTTTVSDTTTTEAPTEKIEIKPNSDEQPTTAPANFNSNLQMIIPGYNGQKRQLAPGESFSFANSVHNEVLLQYTVLYEGHEIWKSPKLDPGTKALFVASDVLSETGAYNLGLVCKGFTPNGDECNSINQTITIILTK